MSNSIYQKAKSSLFWNAGEALFYQEFYLVHQLLLFTFTSKSVYGTMGALFASLFFGIMLLNGAFDSSLVSWFSTISDSQKSFKHFLKTIFLPHTFLITILSCCVIFLLFSFSFYCPPHLKQFLSFEWAVLLALFIISESTKKNLRSLLHLAFKNKTVATIEVANIITYTSLVWGSFFYGKIITPFLLTSYFVAVSCTTTLFLLVILNTYYQTLSHEKQYLKTVQAYNCDRLFLYVNHVCRSLFSSNFLLPFFAFHAGFKEAGIISLVNTLTFSTTFFIQKIFGPTSGALFAQVHKVDTKNKQDAFLFIHKKCIYTVYTALLLFLFNGYHLINATQKNISFHLLLLVVLFFCAHMLETLFIVYEKLFIAEKKSHYILVCNGISFVSCIIAGYFLTHISLTATLLSFMCIRFFALCGLTLFAQKLWNLSGNPELKTQELAPPLLFSLFLSVILKMTL